MGAGLRTFAQALSVLHFNCTPFVHMQASTRRQAKFAAVQSIDRTQSRTSQYEAAKNAIEAFDLFLQQGKGLPIVLHQHPTKGWVLSNHAVSGNVPWWMAFAWRDMPQEEAAIQARIGVWQDIFNNDPRPSVREAVKTLCELTKGDDIKSLGQISNTEALNAAVRVLRLALNSALPVTSPFQVASTTTHCRMKREVVNGDNLPDLLDLLKKECKHPGTVAPRLALGPLQFALAPNVCYQLLRHRNDECCLCQIRFFPLWF